MTNTNPSGLRERKKQLTRAAIVENAGRLFEQRGFEHVTVAEIADASNVSVKTLFRYFPSKEELLFAGEHEVLDEILDAVRARAPGESALDAVKRHLLAFVASGTYEGLDAFHTTMSGNPTLRARLSLMWDGFEAALGDLLAEEAGAHAEDPTPRLVAMQLVALYRVLTTDAVRRRVARSDGRDSQRVLRAWVRSSIALLAKGAIGDYARR